MDGNYLELYIINPASSSRIVKDLQTVRTIKDIHLKGRLDEVVCGGDISDSDIPLVRKYCKKNNIPSHSLRGNPYGDDSLALIDILSRSQSKRMVYITDEAECHSVEGIAKKIKSPFVSIEVRKIY